MKNFIRPICICEFAHQFPHNWNRGGNKRNNRDNKVIRIRLCVRHSIKRTIECVPTDEDKMVIIVAKDNEDHANSIAKTFHEAGVLTIGLLDNADLECYDVVVVETSCTEYPDLIKALLQPIATQGMIAYDFNDLQTALADAKHFFIKSATGPGNERVAESIGFIKSTLASSLLNKIERLSIFLYFNKEGKQLLVMQEMTALTDFLSELPESIDVIWAVYPDESIKDEEIKVSILAAGKELENG